MSQILRWDLVLGGDCTGGAAGDDPCGMYPARDSGDFVKYSDYEALQRENADLQERFNVHDRALAAAYEKIAKLKAPVSDEEEKMWAQELTQEQTWAFSKGSIYNLLQARATQPLPQENGPSVPQKKMP